MKKLLIAALLLIVAVIPSMCKAECYSPSNALLANPNTPDCVTVPAYVNSAGKTVPFSSGDLCQNSNITKTTAVVNISSATTTALVPAVAGKTTYLCTFNASVVGTTPTLLFLTGTQTTTACDTAPVNLSGTIAIVSTTFVDIDNVASSFISATGGQLCVTTGGTAPSVQGVIIYVQQ